MSLISINFLVLVLISGVLYYSLPKKIRWIVLLIASYVFYIISSKGLTIFLLLSTISIYIVALLLNKQQEKIKNISKTCDRETKKLAKKKIKNVKRWIVVGGIIFNIGFLLYLKYFNFFGSNVNFIFDVLHINIQVPFHKLLMPLGISYYTLQALSYIIDVYRGKYEASRHLGKVALFLSFFPQMTEGPIGRFDQLADQLFQGNKLQKDNIKMGCYLILWGIFKKIVIADRAAIFVNDVFKTDAGGLLAVVAIMLYTLQIYAEFSGAMNIVRGVAYLFGVELATNFKRPFFSKSVQEFWRRWHMTLGAWLKDYVFYSVSLSSMNMHLNKKVRKHLKGNFGKFIITAFPLFFVWFLIGFWHGATWKYIFYGLYYYIVMMIGLLFAPYMGGLKAKLHLTYENKGFKIFSILRTTVLVMIGMTIFRAPSVGSAWQMLTNIFVKSDTSILSHGLTSIDFFILLIGAGSMFVSGYLQETEKNMFEIVDRKSLVLRYSILICVILLIVVFGIYGKGYNAGDFIYGEF